MVTSLDSVLAWFDMNQQPVWVIMDSAGKAALFSYGVSLTDENDGDKSTYDFADARSHFVKSLQILSTGIYVVKTKKHNIKGSKWAMECRIDTRDAAAKAAQAVVVAPVKEAMYSDREIMTMMLDRQLKEFQYQTEINQLKRDLDEAKSKKDKVPPGLDRLLTTLEPHVGKIISHVFPSDGTAIGVSGFSKTASKATEATADDQERFEKACQTLQTKVPSLVETMEALARMSETDPGTFNMALNILIKK